MGVKEYLREYSGHNYIYLKSRGNHAIREALDFLNPERMEKVVLVQDQGGWLRYLDYPPKYGYVVEKVKTDYGVIIPDELEKITVKADAIIYEDPAGYFASQPIKEIYEICKKNDCKVILDITGSIGWTEEPGRYADVIICSFGKGKAVNLGYGGFISFKDEPECNVNEEFDKQYEDDANKKLGNLKERQTELRDKCQRIKEELKEFKIIHRERNGINVVVAFDDDKEKERIIRYCDDNNLEYTICPRYIRVLRDAVSIEIKRFSRTF